jgi:hypothetical protein
MVPVLGGSQIELSMWYGQTPPKLGQRRSTSPGIASLLAGNGPGSKSSSGKSNPRQITRSPPKGKT